MPQIRRSLRCLLTLVCLNTLTAEPVSGLSPQDAAKAMKVPDGFHVSLIAGEPDLVQPSAFEFDDRGRLWVAEYKSYPVWKPEGRDRILIFEDTKHDGHFDKRTVFWDKGNYLSGFALGFGGVWVCCAPNLFFIPLNADDTPGEPQVVLDGWGTGGKHNVINSLTWGPDGWLYGCSGITGPGRVGKPGTPDDERIPISCGVWRYHPTKKIFETVLQGTTNPWGIDFDDWGQMFICNTVIGHLWHVVPGMHTQRMFGEDYNKYVYDLLPMCADHIHWAGGSWQSSRGGKGPHDATGGGHSHCGAMIYSGDNWPDQYRNTFFTINTHGNRINNDILKRSGSGYVATHGADILFANDELFRGTAIHSGPDGSVFFADWNQGGECHTGDLKSTGRIFRMTYGDLKPWSGDISKLSDDELVKLQSHKNDWFVRHARRVLQERAAKGVNANTGGALLSMFHTSQTAPLKLRALWALHSMGATDDDLLVQRLKHEDENIRAWTVRLLSDYGSPSDAALAQFLVMAKSDPSSLVRLHLASALQKLPVEVNAMPGKVSRLNILQALLAHGEDASDTTLPLMYWYALEPHIPKNPLRAPLVGLRGQIPLVREFTARRATELSPGSGLDVLNYAASDAEKAKASGADAAVLARLDASQASVMTGILTALKGQRDLKAPFSWKALISKLAASSNADVRKLALKLAFMFGDASAQEKCLALAADTKVPLKEREDAIELLVQSHSEKAAPLLLDLLKEPDLRVTAIRGLAVFDDPKTSAAILAIYQQLSLAEKSEALTTLGARPANARALLEALKNKTVAKEDLNAFTIRYLENANVPELNAWLKANWGGVKQTSETLKASIAKYTKLIKDAGPQAADAKRGHEVFKKTCYTCHTLFGEGGKVGPDLTGSGRANLDYLMLNVVDPNALVANEFMVNIVKTKDGRMLSGLIRNDREKTFDLITPNEILTLSKSDVTSKKRIETSMMPEGILDTLKEQDVIDLAAYLRGDGTK
ncbi:MAG: PVC-type heme-binding CxxCH protein [Planctomycetota bacterium]